MSSGQKRVVFNSRERALSTDQNRLQAFVAADRSILARHRYNDARKNAYKYPGVSSVNVGGETPMSADVFGGLMVDPGTTSVLISPGSIGCLFPDPGATADDSPYLLINDLGVTSTGVLNFTANGTASLRIDFVECSPIEITVETDSRDIFNPTTGLFTPTAIPKVKAFGLQYRIRLGTPGAGLPAVQAGWLPLAVILVPAGGVADFTTCDFYDVRPLVEDRRPDPQLPLDGGVANTEQYCPLLTAEYLGSLNGSSQMIVAGHAESQYGGYKAGGWMKRSSPWFSGGTFAGTGADDGDYDALNLALLENKSASLALAASKILYLVALFPGGLPRWVRYSHGPGGDGASGRIPKGPLGILVVTDHAPFPNGMVYQVPLGWLPTVVGGCCVGTIKCNTSGSAIEAASARGLITNQSRIIFDTTRITGLTVAWQLAAGTHYPVNAAELLVHAELLLTNPSTEEVIFITVQLTGASGIPYGDIVYESFTVPAGGCAKALSFRLPVFARLGEASNSNSGPQPRVAITLVTTSVTLVATANAQRLDIAGWRLQ